MKRLVLAATCALTFLSSAAQAVDMEERWVYVSTNLFLERNVETLVGLISQAREAGATHIQLSDYQSGFMGDMPPRYFAHVARVKKAAAEAGITICPAIFPIGSSGRYLYHNPNLADGIPVKNMRFVVNGDAARVDPSLTPTIENGGFEASENTSPSAWQVVIPQGAPRLVAVDSDSKHAGGFSLKVEAYPEAQRRERVGAKRRVKVEPFHAYTLDVWMKTDGVRPPRHPVLISGARDGRQLSFGYFMQDSRELWPPAGDQSEFFMQAPPEAGWLNGYTDFGIKPTGDWACYRVFFNSLDYDEIELFCGFTWRSRGTIWFDDIEIKPAGLLNVLRRELTPLVVTSEDGADVYVESVDFKRVEDASLGVAPTRGDFMVSSRGTFDFWHRPPAIRLTHSSRIKDGQVLLVSFYSPGIIYVKQQVTMSISDPAVFEFMEQEMKWVSRVWQSDCYMMSYDEIRSAGWEEQPGGAKLSPGELLAAHVTRAVQIAKKFAPDAKLYVWSDMFDPHHNARKLEDGRHYYLVNGSWEGSWEGLPKDVIVYNWGGGRSAGESAKWFADRGHKQVLSGFPVERWLGQTAGLPNIIGFSYTVWNGDYTGMGKFFEEIRQWKAPVAPEAPPASDAAEAAAAE